MSKRKIAQDIRLSNPLLEIAQGISITREEQVWEEKPVPIEEFIESKHFLNQKWNGRTGCRPVIMEIAKETVKENVREIILLLGKGAGKDYLASILHLYGIYKCLCLINPQSYFGLAPSPIYFINTARNETQAMRVFFTQFKSLLSECPWFQGKYNDPGTRVVVFAKDVLALSVNSQAFGWLGFNTLQWVGDELAFFLENDSDEESESRAEECWEAAYGSCQTRFHNDYKMIGITTPRFDDDYVMNKYHELKSRPDAYVVQKATWEVNPNLKKEDFKYAFARDYRRTMRDFGAEPSGVIESFWPEPGMVADFVCETCRNCPVYKNRQESKNIYACWEYNDCKVNAYMGNGHWRDWFKPDLQNNEYYMHFDLAANKDRLGFCLGHVFGETKVELDLFKLKEKMGEEFELKDVADEDKFEIKPLIKIDAIGWVSNQTLEYNVRLLLNKDYHYTAIRDHCIFRLQQMGFNIVGVTFDQYQCLTGDTLIPTDKGMLKLKESQIGDKVLTENGIFESIKNKFEYKNVPTRRITTTSKFFIEGSLNHKLKVSRNMYYNSRTGLNEPIWEWIKIGDIVGGDVIKTQDNIIIEDNCSPQSLQKPFGIVSRGKYYKDLVLPEIMNENLAEFIGLFYGDGSCGKYEEKEWGGGISCHIDELNSIFACVKRTFNFEPSIKKIDGKLGASVQWCSKLLGAFLYENGLQKKSYDKEIKIPDKIMKSGIKYILAFLRGLFSADGSVAKTDGQCSLTTCSLDMALQVKYILQSYLGLRSCIVFIDKNEYGIHYRVGINGSRKIFNNCIGFIDGSPKRNILSRFLDIKGREIYERVLKIEDKINDVYDIEVNNQYLYVANGLISHNSLDMRQILENKGITTDLISLDRTDEIPVAAKYALIEQRIEYSFCQLLCDEAKHLKYVAGKKVDHARKSCFTGNTKVRLLDGTSKSLKELRKKWKIDHKEFWIYAFDVIENKIVPALARNPRKTVKVEKYLRIKLDNGEYVRCTEDHNLILLNGLRKSAKDLKVGESLMPLYIQYKKLGNGFYEQFFDLKDNYWKYTHRLVSCFKYGRWQHEGEVVHHIDFNSRNNTPENLQLTTIKEHVTFHKELVHKLWRDHYMEMCYHSTEECRGREAIEERNKKISEGLQKSSFDFSALAKSNVNNIIHPDGISCYQYRHDITLDKIENLVRKGYMKKQICEELKCSNKCLEYRIRELGYYSFRRLLKFWNVKRNFIVHNKRVDITFEKVYELINRNLSISKIIKSLNCGKNKVRNLLKDNGYRGIKDFKEKGLINRNHKIIEIKLFEKKRQMYDLSVDKWHNFALDVGVFVDQSKDVWDAFAGTIYNCEKSCDGGGSGFAGLDEDDED